MTDQERIERLEKVVAVLFRLVLFTNGTHYANYKVREWADHVLPEWEELVHKAQQTTDK